MLCPQFVKGDFRLLPWQRDWLGTLYGWRKSDGSKRFKRAVCHVSKKNGKTLLVSIVAMFELFTRDTPSPLVCSASTSRENATQVFKELAHSIRRNDKLNALAKITASTKRIRFEKNNAEYRALSADAGSAEGLNLSCCLIDEGHSHRSDKLYRSLEYSTIARPNATLISISTAGNNLSHWYFDLYSKAKRVLCGDDLDTSFFPTIYEIPDTQDVEDPLSWPLANPSIGVSFAYDAFKSDLAAAKGNSADWHNFLRYRCNRWVSGSDESYIDVLKWDQCQAQVDEQQLHQADCYLACDLSQTTDPTALCALWVLPQNRYFCRSYAWVCEEGVRKREKQLLTSYRDYGLTISQGDMIDTNVVKAKILELSRSYRVKGVVFDQYSAYTLANSIGEEGLTVWRSPQSHRFMSQPMKELNTCILEKRIFHDGDKWLALVLPKCSSRH